MAFQSTVNLVQALGKPGTISRLNPVPQHLPYVAEGSDVVAGKFGFAGTDAERQIKGLGAAAAVPDGLVIFERYQPSLGNYADSLKVNAGEEIALLLKGCAYVISTTAATKGQKVLVVPTTGVISTADAVPSSGGAVDTGWVVETGGAANGVCEIMKL